MGNDDNAIRKKKTDEMSRDGISAQEARLSVTVSCDSVRTFSP